MDVNDCLTKKAVSNGFVKVLECLGIGVACCWLGIILWTVVYTVAIRQFTLSLLIGLSIHAAPGILLLCWLSNRRQRRTEAQLIAAVLNVAEGHVVSMGRLSQVTGINNLDLMIARLCDKGYLRHVILELAMVRLESQQESKFE